MTLPRAPRLAPSYGAYRWCAHPTARDGLLRGAEALDRCFRATRTLLGVGAPRAERDGHICRLCRCVQSPSTGQLAEAGGGNNHRLSYCSVRGPPRIQQNPPHSVNLCSQSNIAEAHHKIFSCCKPDGPALHNGITHLLGHLGRTPVRLHLQRTRLPLHEGASGRRGHWQRSASSTAADSGSRGLGRRRKLIWGVTARCSGHGRSHLEAQS